MDEHLSYQIVATHLDGSITSAILNLGQPVSVGSNPGAKLRLSEKEVLPMQADLELTEKNEVVIVNLGDENAMLMNGEGLLTFLPVQWKPGNKITMGAYQLHLVETEEELEAVTERDFHKGIQAELEPDVTLDDTSASEPIGSKDVTEQTTWRSQSPVVASVRDEDKIRTDVLPKVTVPDGRPALLPEAFESAADPDEAVTSPWQISEVTAPYVPREGRGTRYMPAVTDFEPVGIPSVLENTMPKHWTRVERLSAQLTLSQINVALGERIRIPISVRNENSHPVDLHVMVAGLPSTWEILSNPRFKLRAGEIRSLDLILQTQPTLSQSALSIMVRLSDVLTPQIAMTLPLRLILKRTPDLVGWLDPVTIVAPGPTYLNLQNHTRAPMKVFIAGYSETSGVYVVINTSWIEIPAGQVTAIPISIDARQRPLLRGTRYPFWVSAKQGNRAALDFAGVVRVRPRFAALPQA